MIKFLECPDLHFDAEWLEMFYIWRNEILRQAKKQEIDYIAIPADLFKGVITNDNKGGLPLVLDFIAEAVKICPVCAIEGTPSHDSPGSYESLTYAGLTLLKPGKVYGYQRALFKTISEIDDYETPVDSIIFGIPELNKNNIHAQIKGLSSERANATAVELFENYIDEFVAPMRLKYKDIPAHLLFHGNWSDCHQENSTDMVIKSSDIVIHSEVFARANLTRISCGHDHQPKESKICNMGNAGSPGLKWGERGFIPAMNLVETAGVVKDNKENYFVASIKRLPYGTPERKKVLKASSIIPNPNIAYWLVSETEQLPEGIHPWSRLTKPVSIKTTRRATEEQVDNVKSLWDLAVLLDSTIDIRLKPKFEELQEKNKKEVFERINITVDDVEILGCKFFSGDRAYLNISGLNDGLTAIGGEINGMANGIGKSSILSFCSPFPTVVGKDTKGGQPRTLKDFFIGKDSRVIKNLTVNGVKHEHIITIKAAHTKTGGKVECYLNIEGVPQLDKGTFDEMQAMCESLYGSYNDYLLTSFYVQPLQGKTGSSLMSANMTTIRDLVQGIAGIDRSKEKEFANAKKLEIEQALNGIDIKIKYAEDNLDNKDPILLEIKEIQEKISLLISEINEGNQKGKALKVELDGLIKKQGFNEDQKTRKEEKQLQLESFNSKILTLPSKIESLEKSLSTLQQDKEALEKHESDKIIDDKYNSDYKDYQHYIDTFNSLKDRKVDLNKKHDSIIIGDAVELNKKITSLEKWNTDCQKIKDDNTKLNSDYSIALQDYTIAEQNYEHDKFNIENTIEYICVEIKSKKDLIDRYDEPCDHCGKISKSAEAKTKTLLEEIELLEIKKTGSSNELKNLTFDLTPPIKEDAKPLPLAPYTDKLYILNSDLHNIELFTKQKSSIKEEIKNLDIEINYLEVVKDPKDPEIALQPDFIIDNIKRKVENSTEKQIEISTLKNELIASQQRKTELQTDIDSIIIDYTIDDIVSTKDTEIKALRVIQGERQSTGATLQESLKNLNSKIESIDIKAQEIQDMKNGIAKQLQDKDDWSEVAMLMGSNKIPALELDLKLDAIDIEATNILTPYQDGQYSFNSTTQQAGQKQAVDKFDIKIHDSITGIEKSFVEFSPGVKSVFSDAMVKALIKNKNTNSYNPTIKDEADGAIAPKHIAEYYGIQEQFYREDPGMKVLVVSQCTESKAYIENFVDIKDIRCS